MSTHGARVLWRLGSTFHDFNCLEILGQTKGTILQWEDSLYILSHHKAGLHMGQGLLWSTGPRGRE
jgi:hypothetical protein